MDPAEQLAAQLRSALANPRPPGAEVRGMAVLWDHQGNAVRRPRIVANEILQAQQLTPRAPEETLYQTQAEAIGQPLAEPVPPVVAEAAPPVEPVTVPAAPVAASRFACDQCDRDFATEAGLRRHVTTMHKPKE